MKQARYQAQVRMCAAEIQAAISALPPERRTPLKGRDSVTQEALIGVANGDLPIQVFPKGGK